MTEHKDKMSTENKECRQKHSRNISIAGVGGVDYDISSENYDALTADVVSLCTDDPKLKTSVKSEADFAAKWAHVRRNPTSDNASTVASGESIHNTLSHGL